jgi:outer membrane protein OmpA-like peptidoglycan-associated protein
MRSFPNLIDLNRGAVIYVKVINGNRFNLGFDTSDLSPEAERALDEFASKAELLKAKHGSIYIEIQGHTDTSGSTAYRKELGLLMAESAFYYLAGRYELIAGDKTCISSYGSSINIADNSTREGRAKNRRLVLIVFG